MVYRFDQYIFDQDAYRLERNGQTIPLEPRVAELLALLIEERSRVISKEELFDHLWPSQLVSDSALARLVYALRQALDDDAANPRFVRTVPRRGLQFVGDITTSEAPADAANPASSPRRLMPWLAAAAAALIVAIGLNWRPAADAPGNDLGRIVLLGGLAPGADEAGRLALVTLTDMLWVRLREAGGLQVRTPATTSYMGSDTSMAQFARDNAAETILSLTLGRPADSNEYQLSAELIQFAENQPRTTPLGRFSLPALESDPGLTEFLRVRDGVLADLVANAAGMSGAADTTGNADAWRLYLLAREQLQSLDCGAEGARSLLERAVEIDPEFGLAWVALGYSHYNAIWACEGGREEANLALAAAGRAKAIDPGMELTLFLEVSLATEMGRANDGVTLARSFLEDHPDSAVGRTSLAYALTFTGELTEAAAQIDRALELDPLVLERETGLVPTLFLHLGQYQRFLAVTPSGGAAVDRYYTAWALMSQGDTAGARKTLSAMQDPLPRDRFEQFGRVLQLILSDRSEEALPLLDLMLARRNAADAMDGEMDFKLAQLLARAGRMDHARTALQLARQRGFNCTPCVRNDPELRAFDPS
ncbi:MAG: winged helix-turn-helix domain-containing protein [Xanthomonadales bacterium]|nr:winged helix-turn-helix domain-containing protein [Xanthomonadales bacterium]